MMMVMPWAGPWILLGRIQEQKLGHNMYILLSAGSKLVSFLPLKFAPNMISGVEQDHGGAEVARS